MAIQNFQYQKVKFETMLKFVRWFQNAMNLRDWEITLDIGENKPEEFERLTVEHSGGCIADSNYFIALIWINLAACKKSNFHPFEILSHELLHVLFSLLNISETEEHLLIYRLQHIIVEKFLIDNKIKLPKFRKGE